MADESLEVMLPFEFSSSAKPHSMTSYDLDALSEQQQKKLNALKLEKKREDEIYLAAHPEVRAIVALLTRSIFCSRPHSIHEHAAKFFRRPNLDSEVSRYLEANPPEPEYVPPSPSETGAQVGSDVDRSLLEDAMGAMDADTISMLSHISDYKGQGVVGRSASVESVSTIRFIENLISSTFMTPDIDMPSSPVDDSKQKTTFPYEDAIKDMEKISVDYESVQDVTHRIAYDDVEDEELFKTQAEDDNDYDDEEYYDDDYDDVDEDDDDEDGDDDDDDDGDYDRPHDVYEKKDVVEKAPIIKIDERVSDIGSLEEDSDEVVTDWTAPVAPSARKRRVTKEF